MICLSSLEPQSQETLSLGMETLKSNNIGKCLIFKSKSLLVKSAEGIYTWEYIPLIFCF